MKPDWDKLMAEFKDSKTALVGDVDCTAAGKDLCSDVGVRGYPTIKHGDPNSLEDYKGGRDFDSLKKFVKEELYYPCGPLNLGACDGDQLLLIEKFLQMSESDLASGIKEKSDAVEKLETDFKNATDVLEESYKEANNKKDKVVEEVKNSGLALMMAVSARHKAGKVSKMSPSELEAAIKEQTEAAEKLETDFKEFTETLQKSYQEANAKMKKDVAAVSEQISESDSPEVVDEITDAVQKLEADLETFGNGLATSLEDVGLRLYCCYPREE